MGLFGKTKEKNNKELAFQMYNKYTGNAVTSHIIEVNKIFKESKDKVEYLCEIIRLSGTPTTQRDLYVVSHCYVAMGAKFRFQQIEYLTQYINMGGYWKGTPKGKINMGDYIEDQLSANISNEWLLLGKAYEGEYLFDDALNCYYKSLEIDPYQIPAVTYIAKTYVKMNRINDGLKFLKEIKKSGCKDMKLIASETIKELNDKKAKGYVYKARPKK